jgi:hypothetical protein
MIVTLYDLEKICNYSENSKASLPNGIIYYLEFVESDTEEYKNLVKSKRRDLTIDAILEDKIDEWIDSETWGIDLDQEGYTRSISPQMKSLTVKSQIFIDNQTLYYDIVKKLESLTNQPMTNQQNMNVIIKNDPNLTSYDNDNSNFRKIISKIMMLNSMVAMDSRIGPANSMLVGLDVYMYLLRSNTFTIQNNGTTVTGNISGIDIIPSHLINPKKVILMRNATKSEIGLNVINNINDSTYFMAETPGSWEKCIKWFEII